jgi:hypothetical protein
MAPEMEALTKQRCSIEFLHVEKMPPVDIYRRLLTVYEDQTAAESIVRLWLVRFNSDDSEVRIKPRSEWLYTAVSSRNEERFDQLIHAKPRITTTERCTELNLGLNALDTMLSTRILA